MRDCTPCERGWAGSDPRRPELCTAPARSRRACDAGCAGPRPLSSQGEGLGRPMPAPLVVRLWWWAPPGARRGAPLPEQQRLQRGALGGMYGLERAARGRAVHAPESGPRPQRRRAEALRDRVPDPKALRDCEASQRSRMRLPCSHPAACHGLWCGSKRLPETDKDIKEYMLL